MILECVSPAQTDAYVRTHVDRFCRLTGFHCSEIVLKLHDCWPCSRTRWWCVLSAPALGPIRLKQLPSYSDCNRIEHVMPYIIRWPFTHENALALNDEEKVAFQVDHENGCPYLICSTGLLPCPLHAWGSQLRSCPCLCRSGPLSAERLLSRGLFGVVVRSASDASGLSKFRHIHPSECAALVGLDPAADYGDHVLLTLSGIGQIASPIQAAWVGSHVINHFTWLRDGSRQFDPVEHLHAYRSWMLARCQIPWPCDDFVDRSAVHKDATVWNPVMLQPLLSLLQSDEWDFMMSERCLAAVFQQLKDRQQAAECEVIAAALTQMDDVHEAGDAMTDSDEPEPEMILPATETPKFHVVSVPADCAAILYPPAHDVAFVKLSPNTKVQQLLEAEGRLYGFDWTLVTAYRMDGSTWAPNDVLQPGHMAQLCVVPRGSSGDPEYLGFRPKLHGFPGECGQRPLPVVPGEQGGEYGLLPFRLPVNEAAEAVCVDQMSYAAHAKDAALPSNLEGHAELSRGDKPLREASACSNMPVSPCLLESGLVAENRMLRQTWHDQGFVNVGAIRSESTADDPMGYFGDSLSGEVGVGTYENEGVTATIAKTGECRPLPFKLPADDEVPGALHGGRDTAVTLTLGDGAHVCPAGSTDRHSTGPNHVHGEDVQKAALAHAKQMHSEVPTASPGECGLLPTIMPVQRGMEVSRPPMPDVHAKGIKDGSSLEGPAPLANDGVGSILPVAGLLPAQSFPADTSLRSEVLGPHDSCVPRSPLVHLDATSLARMQCSYPTTQIVVNSMKQQVISVADRHSILANQGPLWADDELAWHLANLKRLSHDQIPVVVMDPLLVFGWINVGFDHFEAWMQQYCPKPCCVATVAYVDHYWIPIFLKPNRDTLIAHTWDSQAADHSRLDMFFSKVASSFGLPFHQHVRLVRMFVMPEGCGAMAIAFLAHMILDRMLPTSASEVIEFHARLRDKFIAQGLLQSTCPKPWLWGNGVLSQVESDLAPFLIQHGVPSEQASNRAKAAVSAIGAKPIAEALESKIPWKQLKTLGNQVKFQFLLPSELHNKIAGAAGQGAVGKPKGGKKSKKVPTETRVVELDPNKFAVRPDTFQAGGHPMSQLLLKDVGPLAEGIVMVSKKEAEPYLRHGCSVSQVPLALLIPQCDLKSINTALPHCMVTVPCYCTVNKEPMLIDAVMVQIGVGLIEKTPIAQPLQIDTVDVGTIKFVVFRDELEGSWENFIQGPMRYIVHHMPLLRLCKEPSCKCPHWHNSENIATQDAILDVWRRQFLKTGYRPEGAQSAVMFGVFVRTPSCLVGPLLKLSGTAGIYSEPRSLDGKAIDDSYAIVWVPKTGRAALNHICQTNPSAIGLARIGDRMGIRTTAGEAPDLSQAIRPGSVYLPSGPKLQFLAGPWPFGSDRNNILKALKAMNWEARPLQPLASIDNKGAMWLIQATEEPPSSVVPTSHGDVVISTHKGAKDAKTNQARPVASSATLALCGSQAPSAGSSDPWMAADPWGGFAPTVPQHRSRWPSLPVGFSSSSPRSVMQFWKAFQHLRPQWKPMTPKTASNLWSPRCRP